MTTYDLCTHNHLRREIRLSSLPLVRELCPNYKTATYYMRSFGDVIQTYAVRSGLPPHAALIVLHIGVKDKLDRIILEHLYRRSGFSRRVAKQLTNYGLGGLITRPLLFQRKTLGDLKHQSVRSLTILENNLNYNK